MARTQAADFEQRRGAIVEKAAMLFAAQGFRGTSVADISNAGEISKSLIYHYFPSKEDILNEVMASHIDQLVDDAKAATAFGGTASDQLRTLAQSFMAHYAGAAARQKVLLNELDNLPPENRRAIVTKQRFVIDVVQRLLIEIDPTIAPHPERARVKTMLFFGMINWAHTWYDPAGPVSPAELADMTIALIDRTRQL